MRLSSFFRSKSSEAEDSEGAFASRAETASEGTRTAARRKSSKQAAQPVDPVLPEKKRARRRLVGAVALVLAAVIGLPMVLDSEPKPLAEDIVIQIPSKDQPVGQVPRTRVSNDTTTAVPAGAALDQREEVIDAATPTLPDRSGSSATSGKTAGTTKPVQAASEPTTSAAKPETLATASKLREPKSTPKPTSKATPKLATESVPETAPKSATASVPKSTVATNNADSARAISILDGAAESGKADQPDKKDSKAGKDGKPAHLMVQVAALTSKEKVAELQGKLKAAGIMSHTQAISTDSGARIRVRIGPFGSREEADKARARLTGIGLTGSVVPG